MFTTAINSLFGYDNNSNNKNYIDETIENGYIIPEDNQEPNNNVKYDEIYINIDNSSGAIYEEEEDKVIEYSQHFAFNFYDDSYNDNYKIQQSRDFHKVVLELYKLIPESEKNDRNLNYAIVTKLNSFIMSWHSMAPELWCHPQYGVWAKLCYYCCKRFPKEKYPDIYNLIC